MIRKITLLLLLCAGLSNTGKAQYSGFENAQQRLLSAGPGYAQRLHQMTTNWVNWNNHQPNIAGLVLTSGNIPVFQIPVVVHVILPGSLAANPQGTNYDPTDAQINGMIAYLNQAFSATYVSYPDSNSGGTYVPIQFVLAKRDSNCNTTTGIERIDGSAVTGYVAGGIRNGTSTGAIETAVKDLSRWPTDQYYNIYIVNKIDGKDGLASGVAFTTGFGYLPTAPANVDGYTVLASQVAPGNVNIVTEMGHAFSLYNTFQGGSVNTCPVNTNCATDGDQVCDTPPILQLNFTCPASTDINTCDGTNTYGTDPNGANAQHNFMNYSSCQDRFTPGQRARMIFGLYTYRSGMLGSLGATAPGVSPAPASCSPTITNAGNTDDAGVTEFKISDPVYNSYLNNTTNYLDYISGGYNSEGNVAYIDRTCHQEATLIAGNSYKFFVRTGGTVTGENVAVYIDYNNDGVFGANEQVMAHTGTTANELDSALIAIPTSISNPSLVTCVPLRVRVIADAALVNVCGPLATGQAEDYTIVIAGNGSTSGTVTVSLPTQSDTTCIGSPLTFTATPSAGVDPNTAVYTWYVNGVSTGVTGVTYTTSNIADGAAVSVKLNFTNQCGGIATTTSSSIVVHRFTNLAPRVSIALTSGNNPGCPGDAVTFTATPFNGGTTPAYQWLVNGVNVGGNSSTYTSTTLIAGDSVSCILYSSSSCAVPIQAVSNKIGILHYYLTATLSISATPNPSCAGTNVVLTATSLNQSANSQYQWYVNSTPVAGATSATFVSNSFQNTDIVRCVMISPSACIVNHSDTSNPIVISVGSTISATVASSIQTGSNPGCIDSAITFTGTSTGYGTPDYEWLVDGVPVFNGQTFTTDTLKNGDIVQLRVSDVNGCYTSDTLFALPITLTLSLTPDPPVISLINNILVANANGVYNWYGPNGLIPSVTGPTDTPTVQGFYYIQKVDSSCPSKASNIIEIKIGANGVSQQYKLTGVNVYPNPTTGLVQINWGTVNKDMKVIVYNGVGQCVLYNECYNQSAKEIDLGMMAAGNYYIVLRSDDGKTSTTPITLNNK